METQLSRHDDMLSVHEIRLADMDLRFQVLETASFNGTLIWKIREYKRRKQDAVASKTSSLYSQPFYTGYFGYKMCARVYLNGDGMGKGTHLSLFFVVMRGEYDALLPWPFKQKVTRLSALHLSVCATPVCLPYTCLSALQLSVCPTAVCLPLSCLSALQLSVCPTAVYLPLSCLSALQLSVCPKAVCPRAVCAIVQVILFVKCTT